MFQVFKKENNGKVFMFVVKDWKELWQKIHIWSEATNQKICYVRQWVEDGELVIDYGDWSSFILVNSDILKTQKPVIKDGDLVEYNDGTLGFYWEELMSDDDINNIKGVIAYGKSYS